MKTICIREVKMNIATIISEKLAKFSPLVGKIKDIES
jgi:hypothetical protein